MKIGQPKDVDPSHKHYMFLNLVEGDNLMKAFDDVEQKTIKLFREISEIKLNSSYAEGKWSIKQLLKHIIDSERFFCYTAFRFSRGEKLMEVGFDENMWALNDYFIETDLEVLMEEYLKVRQSTKIMFNSMNPERLDVNGVIEKYIYTPRMLGWVVVGHNLHHLNVIKERYM